MTTPAIPTHATAAVTQTNTPSPKAASATPQSAGAAIATAVRKSVPGAAVAESSESPAQTLSEAAHGDRQAQKLLHHGTVGTQVNTKA